MPAHPIACLLLAAIAPAVPLLAYAQGAQTNANVRQATQEMLRTCLRNATRSAGNPEVVCELTAECQG